MRGLWRPWFLSPSNPIYSELTGISLIPGFILFPHHPILASKAVPILMGSLIPLLLALIAYKLSQRQGVFIATAVLATLNPWLFQFSRMGFDSLYGLFFYLLGVVILLYARSWHRLWAIMPFFWGFFQYQGFKPILVPLVLLTSLYLFLVSKKQIIPLIFVNVFCLILVLSYLIRLPNLNSSVRLSEFSLLSHPSISQEVNDNRRLTFTNPFSEIVDNKITVSIGVIAGRLLNAFDLPWLFNRGNTAVDTFAVTQFGFLYLIDLFLVVTGFVTLWSPKQNRATAFYLTLFLLIGTLPHLLKNDGFWLTFRGSFQIMGLIMIAGFGVDRLFSLKIKALNIFLIVVYVLGVLGFAHNYALKYPVQATTNSAFYARLVAQYLIRQPQKHFTVVVDNPQEFLDHLLVYNQLISKNNLPQLRSQIQSDKISLHNFTLTSTCPTNQNPNDTWIVIASNEKCVPPETSPSYISIASLIDSGARFKIYNDSLCSQSSLSTYTHVSQNRFNLDKLSVDDFCQSFFTKSITF